MKLVCEQFISETTDSFIAPLNSILDKIDTILKMAEIEGKDGKHLLKQQPFAKAGKITDVLKSLQRRKPDFMIVCATFYVLDLLLLNLPSMTWRFYDPI